MSAGGVVADHAADGGPVRRRGIGAELESHRPDVRVELILDQSRLNAAPEFSPVHVQDVFHVLRKI